MISRVYKKKLLIALSIIGLVTAVVCGLLFTYVMYSINSNTYEISVRNIAAARTEAAKLALDVIWEAHKSCAENENVRLWGYSDYGSNEYYFYSVRLYQDFSRYSSSTQDIDYEIAVTRLDDDSFVIMQSGTVTKAMFNDMVLPASAMNSIGQSLAAKGIIPVLDEKGDIESLALYTRTLSGAVVITTVPISSLGGPEDEFSLVINGEHYAPSSLRQSVPENVIDAMMRNNESECHYDDSFIYVVNSEISSLRFVFYYPSTPANMKLVTIVSIAVMVMFIVLFMCVSVAVTNVLYRPVSETVGKLDSAPDDEGRIDEFALFDSTLDTLENLKDRYDQLIKENNRLSSSRYFYELLYDPDPMMDSPLNEEETDALYSVALFEYSISDDVSDEYFIQLEKTNVMVHVRSMRARYRIHYLNLSSTRFVIIFENVPHNIIRSEAASFFNVLDEGVTLSVALSDERRGIREIHNSYRQAKRIIEYRNLVNVHAIMTQSDIPDDTSDYFYYPIHTENRIVSLVVSGDRDKALSLFDSIIDENFTRAVLTNDARMNLMYSLVGTLIRIMQELKTSPVELIGRPFDFTWLYSNWANESIIERLRQNISDIAEAVAEKRNSSVGDEIVLDKMRAFIYENYSDNIMLIDIAEHLGITPKYCSALFKKLSNENFKTFLNQYRIDRACEFIRDNPDIKVADLAQQVGFNSANTFIRVFKTYKGITPGAFAENVIRERHAQE